MKKIVFVGCAVCLLLLTIKSQNQKFEVGVTGAAGASSLLIGPDASGTFGFVYKPKFAYSFGVSFQYNFNEFFGLVINPNYLRKGGQLDGEFRDGLGNSLGTHSVVKNFNYFSTPFLARFTFGKNVRFFANAGGYFGYLINQISVYPDIYGSNFPEVNNEIDNTENWDRFDFGLSTGVGIIIPLGESFSLSVELRDNFGLKDISKNGGLINTTDTWSNNIAYLQVGFAYGFGG